MYALTKISLRKEGENSINLVEGFQKMKYICTNTSTSYVNPNLGREKEKGKRQEKKEKTVVGIAALDQQICKEVRNMREWGMAHRGGRPEKEEEEKEEDKIELYLRSILSS